VIYCGGPVDYSNGSTREWKWINATKAGEEINCYFTSRSTCTGDLSEYFNATSEFTAKEETCPTMSSNPGQCTKWHHTDDTAGCTFISSTYTTDDTTRCEIIQTTAR